MSDFDSEDSRSNREKGAIRAEKLKALLGMSFGAAANILLKDILFDFVMKAGYTCFRCQGELTRDTFSIEHKAAWRKFENPSEGFFDLTNIAFSHKRCNTAAGEKIGRTPRHGGKSMYDSGCRCDPCKSSMRLRWRKPYTTEDRRRRYAIEKERRSMKVTS